MQNQEKNRYRTWAILLSEFIQIIEENNLNIVPSQKYYFTGMANLEGIEKFEGINYGPLSTTTNKQVAESFIGKDGIIIAIKSSPKNNPHYKPKMVDISWVSPFKNEKEILFIDSYIIIDYWERYENYKMREVFINPNINNYEHRQK